MLPDKIGAIILKSRKILLVSDDTTPFFWIPGGKVEPGEDHHGCLRRKLQEELGVQLKHAKFYTTKTFLHEMAADTQMIHYYLLDIQRDPEPRSEITRMHWFSKEDFLKDEPKTTNVLREQLLPMLIEEGLL